MTENDKTIPMPGGLDRFFDTVRRATGDPRILDLCYTAFMRAKDKNDEDGGPTDWFTDTKPQIDKLIAKMRVSFSAGMNAPAVSPTVQEGVADPEAASCYGDVFNAIAAATTLSPPGIGISVKVFLEALKAHAVVPLATPTPDRQKAESEQGASIPCKVPEGWKLVPVTPTAEMLEAAEETAIAGYTGTPVVTPGRAWAAMLATAPQPPVPTAPASGGSAVAVEEVERLAARALTLADAAGWARKVDPEADKAYQDLLDAIRRLAAPQANDGVRDAALEEAAKVVEGEPYKTAYRRWPALWIDAARPNRGREHEITLHCDALAAAIRALKADTKTTPGPVEDAILGDLLNRSTISTEGREQGGLPRVIVRFYSGVDALAFHVALAKVANAASSSQKIGEQAERQGGV